MFRHQLSRLTSYTLKYTGMGGTTSEQQDTLPSPELIEYWVAEAQRGLDALLNDQFDQAEIILSQHASVSPFHAVAYALMAYVEAMLAFDVEKIRIASARIAAAEDLARQHRRHVRKRGWYSSNNHRHPATIPLTTTINSEGNEESEEDDPEKQVSIAFDDDIDDIDDDELTTDHNGKINHTSTTLDFTNSSTTTATTSSNSTSSNNSSRNPNDDNASSSSSSSINSAMTAPEEPDQEQVPYTEQHQQNQPPSITAKNMRRTFDLQCELLEINCILMGATTQFMGNSWLEYMKATYRLRKSYKMYEHMFTHLTGQKPSDFASLLKKQNGRQRRKQQQNSARGLKSPLTTTATVRPFMNRSSLSATTVSPSSGSSSLARNEKRFSLFGLPTAGSLRRKPSSIRSWNSSRRSSTSSSGVYHSDNNNTHDHSNRHGKSKQQQQEEEEKHDGVVESGVFFGIGLFSLIFSLLPPKVNKILNTLGFHSSRPFALHVLQKSYQSNGLYSGLSALTLLVYFTNLSLFIHPRLLPNSMTPETTRNMLNHMKIKYPNSKIWELLEGKLCKMEGKPRKGVEILRDARRRHSINRVDLGGGTKKWVNETTESSHHSHQQQSSTEAPKKNRLVVSELAQLQGLAVYEMGWAQVFLGDYFQASETFFRLESMNNWSRAFYHYIATCCMFADEQYDKAGMEFQQIPNILDRKRQLGGRLLPNEMFAERKIKRWREKAHALISQGNYIPPHLQWMPAAAQQQPPPSSSYPYPQQQQPQRRPIHPGYMQERYLLLDGELLKQVVIVNPLWELIYLWNGIPQLSKEMLQTMKEQLQTTLDHQEQHQHERNNINNNEGLHPGQDSNMAILRVILGAVVREQGDFVMAEKCFQATMAMEAQVQEDRWVIPYAMYELAVLHCFKIQQNTHTDLQYLIPEIRSLIKRAEQYFQNARRNNNTTNLSNNESDDSQQDDDREENSNNTTVDEGDHHDWDSRLHVRCQLLMEKVDELQVSPLSA
ncbi:hypothetical protein BDA99DRAFT_554980 [Phascolomyces articulosus]|uniref:Inclusion body clearance protein IML2 n=1 Tax=Phascolomyces articulosus TaxID=60185 RepID=A0AAD5KB52_9FUNG|nr:hypothetical protein BDA99DRAFT_554980 [Phascolomyces articulosus]